MENVYLHDIPLDQAWAHFRSALEAAGLSGPLGKETIPIDEQAVGRVLLEPVWARLSSPHYHAAAMDGFALRAVDTAQASPANPVTLTIGSQASYVDTGDILPDWADAVLPIEQVEALDEQGAIAAHPRQPAAIRMRSAVAPWMHVRPLGEDIVATELVLPAGRKLRPVDLGAAAASGHTQVTVARRPRVAILPTGSELVAIGSAVRPGDIIEFNSVVLASQVQEWGGLPQRFDITPDDLDAISAQVRDAAEQFDLVLLNAGSSAGSEDFSARVVEKSGELLVHGVAVRPGHPVIIGMIRRQAGDKVPLIGIPGYPVSAALTGEIFVEPLLASWQGRAPVEPMEVEAELTRKLVSPGGDDDYVRIALGRVGDRLLAAPLARGAGVISSLVRADGIAVVPRGSQGKPAGAKVTVRLYRSPAEIERTILAIGSHDISLDVLAQFLAGRQRRLSSANAGSQAGLVALRRQEAHFAGSHLLDPQSGEYNLSYIRQYLPEVPVQLVNLVGREQGLMVPRNNPQAIRTLQDLRRPEVHFVNRQRGAGTRVLLDYHLQRLGIVPAEIQGYDREEYTHLAVAAAVASGRASCGLGIKAAALALHLDFIPLFQERYDLVIPTAYAGSELLRPLFETINDPKFQSAVADLPGYDVSQMGNLVAAVE